MRALKIVGLKKRMRNHWGILIVMYEESSEQVNEFVHLGVETGKRIKTLTEG